MDMKENCHFGGWWSRAEEDLCEICKRYTISVTIFASKVKSGNK